MKMKKAPLPCGRGAPESTLTDAFLDERCDFSDVVWSNSTDSGIDVQARDQIIVSEEDLQYGEVALQVQHLVEAYGNVALLDPIDRRRREVDTTDDHFTG